jgi:regulator of protease activity HflC (stomatin/prohibitin superfamily)
MFVWAIIFAILAIVGVLLIVAWRKQDDEYEAGRRFARIGAWIWTVLFGLLAVLFTVFSTNFSVETGSSVVLKDWSGVVQEDAVTTTGFHTKAPWQDTIAWDIKNQDVTFTGDGSTTHDGQQVAGAEIVFIDKDGISAPMDIQVLFSIKADAVVPLTKGFTDQNDFEIKVVENDVKSIPRDIAGSFTTVEMFSERPRLRAEITEALTKAWAKKGVIVENVNIHGIRYPEDVQQRFKDAQNAETDLLKAETDAKTAKTKADGEAQAAISRATGEAEANRLLAASLTPEIIAMRQIEALANANTIVVPQNFNSLGQLPAAPQ